MKTKIIKLNHQGKGITYINDKITFVTNALKDEEVNIEITKENKKYNEAIVTSYITSSPSRVTPACPYYNKCGGCNLMHMDYKSSLVFKETKLKEILHNFDSHINNIVPSPKIFHYRNKLILHNNSLYETKTNNEIEIKTCLIASENINNMIKPNKGEKTYKDYDYKNMFYLNNYKFISTNDSFFQINKEQTINMYNIINEYIIKLNKPNVIDLYCGVGSIGIYISKNTTKVLGIEINKNSFICANKNILLNNITNVEIINASSDIINTLDIKEYTTLVVDPPRSGLSKTVLSTIIAHKFNTIIYVSCDPMTLSRDLLILNKIYDVIEITPLDMFPQTYHVECVSLLVRKTFENNNF